MTNQPPPPSSIQDGVSEPHETVSLASTITKLYDLIFEIALPKTNKAKMAPIPVGSLHLAHKLVTSACASLQDSHSGLQLSNISKQLESITTHLGILDTTQPTQKRTYASVLSAGAYAPTPPLSPSSNPQSCHTTRYGFTLAQTDRDRPVFAGMSNPEIIKEIY